MEDIEMEDIEKSDFVKTKLEETRYRNAESQLENAKKTANEIKMYNSSPNIAVKLISSLNTLIMFLFFIPIILSGFFSKGMKVMYAKSTISIILTCILLYILRNVII